MDELGKNRNVLLEITKKISLLSMGLQDCFAVFKGCVSI